MCAHFKYFYEQKIPMCIHNAGPKIMWPYGLKCPKSAMNDRYLCSLNEWKMQLILKQIILSRLFKAKQKAQTCTQLATLGVYCIRAVATAPEKTPTEKVKFFELRDHHQSIPRQKLPVEKKNKSWHPLFTRCKCNTTTTTTTRRFKRHFAIE